jgi:response regulator NasT
VAAVLPSAFELPAQVLATRPDVIFIQADSSRDTLEHLAIMNRDCPRPVLMCSPDSDSGMIRRAVKAGVSSYVIDSVSPERLDALVEVSPSSRRFKTCVPSGTTQPASCPNASPSTVPRACDEGARARRGWGLPRAAQVGDGARRKLADVAQDVIEMAKLLL